MKYKNYKVDDFLRDEDFKSWVRNPTQESNYFWSSWMSNHPNDRKRIEMARTILLSVDYARHEGIDEFTNHPSKERIFSDILSGKNSKNEEGRKKKSLNYSTFYKIAALLVLGIGLSFMMAYQYFSNESIAGLASPHENIVKSNDKGRTSTITLPDGSVVRLGFNSSIRYLSSFTEGSREVWLTGQAYFDVVKSEGKSFFVYTDNIYIEVLGTSFGVKKWSDESNLEVALMEGKVMIGNEDHTITQFLSPQEKIIINTDNYQYKREKVNYDLDIGWKDGILFLRDESISTLSMKLENWFGVRVIVVGVNGNHQYSGRFNNKSLEYIMDALSYASNIEYRIEGKVLYILNKENKNE